MTVVNDHATFHLRWLPGFSTRVRVVVASVVAAACTSGIEVPQTDACTRFEEPDRLFLDVAISVSADVPPVISWTPTSCLISALEVYRHPVVDDCQGRWGCGAIPSYRWRITTLTDSSAHLGEGPATIAQPVQYGVVPATATEALAPSALAVGDSVVVVLWRRTTDVRWGPQGKEVIVRIGTGATRGNLSHLERTGR